MEFEKDIPEKSYMDDKFGEETSFKQCNSGKPIEYSLQDLKSLCGQLANVAAKMNFMLEYHQSECTDPTSLALLVMRTSAYVNGLVNSLQFTTNHCQSQLEDLFPGKDLMSIEKFINKRECENEAAGKESSETPKALDADIDSDSSLVQGSSDSDQQQDPSEEPAEDNFPVEIPQPAEDEAAERESCGSLSESVILALECFGNEIDNDAASSTSSTPGKRKMSNDPDYAPHGRNSNLTKMLPTETSTSTKYSVRRSKRRIIETPSVRATDYPLTSEKLKTTPTAEGPAPIQAPLEKKLAISQSRLSGNELNTYKISSQDNKCDKEVKVLLKKLSPEEVQKWCVRSASPAPKSCEMQTSAQVEESEPPFENLCGVPPPPLFEQNNVGKRRKSKRLKLKNATELEETVAEVQAAPVAEPSVSTAEVYQPETMSIHTEMSLPPDNDKMDYQNGYENDGLNDHPTLDLCNEMSAPDDNDVILPPQGPQPTLYLPATLDDKVNTNNDLKIKLIKTKPPPGKRTKCKYFVIEKGESSGQMFPCEFCESYYAPIPSIDLHMLTCKENPVNKCTNQVETNENKEMFNEIVGPVILASRKIPDGPVDKEADPPAEPGQLDADVEISTTGPGAPPEIQIEKIRQLQMLAPVDNVNVILLPNGPQPTSYATATVNDVDNVDLELKTKRLQRKKTERKHSQKIEKARFLCHICGFTHKKGIHRHIRTCNGNPLNKSEKETRKQLVKGIDKCVIPASRKIPGQLNVEIATTECGAARGNQIENRSHLNNITKIDNSEETSEPIDIMDDSDVEITEVLPNRSAAATASTSSIIPTINSEPEIPPTNPHSIAQDLYGEAMHPIPLINLKRKRKNTARHTTKSKELKTEFAMICAFCDTVPRFTCSKAFQWHHDANHGEMGSPVIKCSRCRHKYNMFSIEEVLTHKCKVESDDESLP